MSYFKVIACHVSKPGPVLFKSRDLIGGRTEYFYFRLKEISLFFKLACNNRD